jgi:hypothetical protein
MAANFGHAGAEEPLIFSNPKRDLVMRSKSDPDKMVIAARLGRETMLTIKAIAALVPLGSSEGANGLLPRPMKEMAG